MEVTIESIKAAHETVAAMIAQFETQRSRTITIAAYEIRLAEGEHYAGMIRGDAGMVSHHLILLPGDVDDVSWDQAQAWAEKRGATLPTRREQHLLIANLKDQFEPRWYWSCEQHASEPSGAWLQNFSNGNQNGLHKSYEGRARAVRRLEI
jgi:hypothetical protein